VFSAYPQLDQADLAYDMIYQSCQIDVVIVTKLMRSLVENTISSLKAGCAAL
jgi:hypothetical protein